MASMPQTGKRRTVITLSHSNQPAGCSYLRQCSSCLSGRGRHPLAVEDCLMFLICSQDLLCSEYEPSILSCPQAPAGHGALRTGGGAFSSFPTCGRQPTPTASPPPPAHPPTPTPPRPDAP